MKEKRSVIVHYHTFKNSGTSFDELLTANYQDAHLCFDGPFPYTLFNQQELLKVIRRNPNKIAFSSHSIRLPVPTDLEHQCNRSAVLCGTLFFAFGQFTVLKCAPKESRLSFRQR